MKSDIKSLTIDEIEAALSAWSEPKYRAAQLADWLYRHLVCDWDAMTNLPQALRHKLAQHFTLHCLQLVAAQQSADGTRKFLWRLHDGNLIESVLIPANPALYGPGSERTTICVSTQVGCPFRCAFCASGLHGLKRNLSTDEIVEQVLAIERWYRTACLPRKQDKPHPWPSSKEPNTFDSAVQMVNQPPYLDAGQTRPIDNVVVMGMGEPLVNYDNVIKALRILNAPWGVGIGARKITISTAGYVPGIRRLANEKFQFRLAISLHAATDDLRSKLMPINRKYPIHELVKACQYYLSRKGKIITLEYLLIDGVNDGLDQAKALAGLARKLGAKVNLIPYNPVEGLNWKRPSITAQRAFHRALKSLGASVTLRREKGADIDAACGQLRLRNQGSVLLAGDSQLL